VEGEEGCGCGLGAGDGGGWLGGVEDLD